MLPHRSAALLPSPRTLALLVPALLLPAIVPGAPGLAAPDDDYLVEVFPNTAFDPDPAAMDLALGLPADRVTEGFEAAELIPGLGITLALPGGSLFVAELPALNAQFSPPWDGASQLLGVEGNHCPGPVGCGAAIASATQFDFPPVELVGIGIGGFQSKIPPADVPLTNHDLFVNGEAFSFDVEELGGILYSPGSLIRNAYIVIRPRHENAPAITSIRFENREADDVIAFDHLVLAGDGDADGAGYAEDNCTRVANPGQEDADAGRDDDASLDGIQHYGDACDVDLDNDGVVGVSDFFSVIRPCLGTPNGVSPLCDKADLDRDGVVGPSDFFGVFRPALGSAPGPGISLPAEPSEQAR